MAEVAIHTALEHGILAFDHADIYAFGKAESVFGNVLSKNPDLREQMTIQSKAGIKIGKGPGGSNIYDLSKKYLLKQVEDILKGLRIEYLDTFLLHRPDPLMDPGEIASAFDELYSKGLVREFGVSNMSIFQIQMLQRYCDRPLVTNQVQLSLGHAILLDLGVTVNTSNAPKSAGLDGLLEFAQLHSMSIQTWGSLDGGLYTGGGNASNDDAIRQTSALINELAEKYNSNPNAIALAWLMAIPGNIHPVIGTTNIKRIKQCAEALEIHMSRQDWYDLWITSRAQGLP